MDKWIPLILTLAGTLIIAIASPFIVRWIRRKQDPNSRRKLMVSNIPVWLVEKAYQKRFPTRNTLGASRFTIKGIYYQYEVIFRDSWIYEPQAKIGHMTVYRKKRDDK